MSVKPDIGGSYTLISPTTVSVAGSKSTTVGNTTVVYGAGTLSIYIASLPSGVSATIKVNNISVSLVPGFNHMPLPAGVTVYPITLTNSNTASTALSVSLWALITHV